MICPVCEGSYSEMVKYFTCETLDDSYLYRDVTIHKCNNCGHMFNPINSKEIKNLRKYYEVEHPKPEMATLLSRPEEDNSLDGVVLDQILEHTHHPRLALKEARRVLKKGGLCWVNVPDASRYNDNYFWIMREHIQHFNLTTIKLLAHACGFELVGYTKNEIDMAGKLKLPNLSVVLKPMGTTYCYGIGREFLFLHINTRLRYMNLILVDDKEKGRTFKGQEIHGSEILKEADKDSFLIITANVYKEELTKRVEELGYKGVIIDV